MISFTNTDTPLTESYDKETRFFMLLSYLNEEQIDSLNGSVINKEEVDGAHRKFISYYAEKSEKPERFFEIKTRLHSKLAELLSSKKNSKALTVSNVKQSGKENKILSHDKVVLELSKETSIKCFPFGFR
jgi:hypothetical protein